MRCFLTPIHHDGKDDIQMRIIKYEFITHQYPLEPKYIHWSRIYEWKYVIDVLAALRPASVHNTACGGLNSGDCLHLTFCGDIERHVGSVTHSDVWGRGNYVGIEKKPDKANFIFYDILTPHEHSYDVVLNLSTLEHLAPTDLLLAFDNLYHQVKRGGQLILTFDYPDVNLKTLQRRVATTPLNYRNRIVYKRRLSVVLLHIYKDD